MDRPTHGTATDSGDGVTPVALRALLVCTIVRALTSAAIARADLTASYDGTLTIPKVAEQAIVASGLLQAGSQLTATVAVSAQADGVSGVYYLTGSTTRTRFKLTGSSGTGVVARWKGRLGDPTLAGAIRLAGAAVRYRGTLTISKRVSQPPIDPPATCTSEFFNGQVMGTVLVICAGCHVPGGAAEHTTFRVTMTDPLATEASIALQIDTADPDHSRILEKPLAILPHAGGQRFLPGSTEDQILRDWVHRVATSTQCDTPSAPTTVALRPNELLVRAAMDLRGKRPTLAELDAVEADPTQYGTIVDGYLHSPEFLERVKDVYDDALLVRREDFTDEARDETSAIYGEALELIAYIVDHDRPFTEIGTADYTVANDLFQRDRGRMPYAMEPVVGPGWQPTHYLDDRPHAGLLSTSAFYEVWDTNNTNKNRRRANRWSIVFHCYNFLDTPVDVTRDVDNNDPDAVLNAVTTRTDCKACHDRLDPMASFLFPTDNATGLEDGDGVAFDTDFFSGDPERWRTANKRPPAVYGKPGTDLRDYGRLMVEHEKFARCQTERAFQLLFLRKPKTSHELALAGDIATQWVSEDGYDFRKLVRRWMLSDAYTEMPIGGDADWVRRAGPARLETLVGDLTGFVWSRDPQDDEDDADPNSDPPRTAPVPLLTTDEDGYNVILGGIDGTSVTGRSSSLNASVVIVQRKLAALAADWVMTNDLVLPDAQRTLLHGVTGAEQPTTDEAAIRTVLVALARRLYGERWASNAPEIDTWFGLYRSLYADYTQSGTGYRRVSGTRAERAWRGTLVAMLRSPRLILY